MLIRSCRFGLVGPAMVCLAAGCAVGQKPGRGQVLHRVEPRTAGGYYLYLPQGYDQAVAAQRHLPLVMTFHGMKPFDNAGSQIREWQQEADRYSYVVCAPQLLAPDLLSPVPLRQVTGSLKRDEERILAIMDELEQTTNIDPNAVLVTSWSYGGYLAHYMANRHPERFSCIAVKQSNFCEDILDPQTVRHYRDHKVGIFYTQNDFRICREESRAAAQWYSRHGFDLTFAVFQDLGHERRPGVAASFFARTCGATPRTPPVELARMKILELPAPEPTTVAMVESAARSFPPRPRADRRQTRAGQEVPPVQPRRTQAAPRTVADPRRPDRQAGTVEVADARDTGRRAARQPAGPKPTPLRTRPVTPPAKRTRAANPKPRPAPPNPEPDNPVRIRLSSTIGIAPLLVSYSVAPLPLELSKGAFFLWTDNGEPISNAVTGQKLLTAPGAHRLEVLVTAADGTEHRAGDTVTVLERVNTQGTPR